jgi:hypothetical protein
MFSHIYVGSNVVELTQVESGMEITKCHQESEQQRGWWKGTKFQTGGIRSREQCTIEWL